MTPSGASRPSAPSGGERGALTEQLPEAAAAAVIDFLTTVLVTQPRRVGKPLRDELAGVWAARRGTYRALYPVREETHGVVVLRIDHRRDVYRPHWRARSRMGAR